MWRGNGSYAQPSGTRRELGVTVPANRIPRGGPDALINNADMRVVVSRP